MFYVKCVAPRGAIFSPLLVANFSEKKGTLGRIRTYYNPIFLDRFFFKLSKKIFFGGTFKFLSDSSLKADFLILIHL